MIYQQQKYGCGFACIKMFLVHVTHNTSFKNLVEPNCDLECPSLTYLTLWAKSINCHLNVYKASSPRELLKNKNYPIILLINRVRANHCVYLYKRKGKFFYLMDPAIGKVKIRDEELVKQFTGVFMTGVYKGDNKVEVKEKNLGFKFGRILLCIIEGLSFGTIFASFYFISDEGNFLIPLILYTVFVFLKIIERLLLEKLMKKFDQKYSLKIDYETGENRRTFYKLYLDFKTQFFSGPIKLFADFAEVVIFSLILCLNDVYYSIGLSLCLFVSILLFVLGKNRIKERETNILILEENYLTNNLHSISSFTLLNEAYRFSKIKFYKELFFIFFDFVICLLLCLFSEIVTLNYLIFSAITIFYIQSKINSFLSYSNTLNEYRKNKAMFIRKFM